MVQTYRGLKPFRCISNKRGDKIVLDLDNPVVSLELSGHYSHGWSESVNVIRVISEPFAREL